MDGFHEVLVNEKNPQAPGLVPMLKEIEGEIKEAMGLLPIPPAVELWAKRMSQRYGPEVYCWHLLLDWKTALMCERYGFNPKLWPDEMSPGDLSRALGWESGRIPGHTKFGTMFYAPPIAGGAELTDYMEAQIGNHLYRTQLTTINAWAASTAYSLGDIVQAVTWNDTLFECVVAGTSGGSEPAWDNTIGNETTDNTVTWQALKVGLPKRTHFYALFTAAPGETGGGTEVSGGAYARVQHAPVDANWNASTQVGGAGRIDNLTDIVYPAPTANWGTITSVAEMTRLTGGNMKMYSDLTTSKTVNNGDPAPKFSAGDLDIDWS